MNLSARTLTRIGDGISVRDGRLAAASPEQDAALALLVGRAVDADNGGVVHEPGAVAVSRSCGSAPPILVVRPLETPNACHAKGVAKAVIFVSEPEHGLRTSRERLRRLFELTPAEADLLAFLVAGQCLREAAARFRTERAERPEPCPHLGTWLSVPVRLKGRTGAHQRGRTTGADETRDQKPAPI
jgi:hypothetical protein